MMCGVLGLASTFGFSAANTGRGAFTAFSTLPAASFAAARFVFVQIVVVVTALSLGSRKQASEHLCHRRELLNRLHNPLYLPHCGDDSIDSTHTVDHAFQITQIRDRESASSLGCRICSSG